MKGQLRRLGISYAWERELATCDRTYYKWNQWLFLKMYERDLAYRQKSKVNWCPSCATVLANEQVVDGECWRCDSTVADRELEQWFLRVTKYSQHLLDGIDELTEWPEKVLTMQQNWIGRSEGALVQFPIVPSTNENDEPSINDVGLPALDIFTTRIDTIFGATFLLLAPEHSYVQHLSLIHI